MPTKRQYVGQIQRPGERPQEVRLFAESSDVISPYKIRHLNVTSSSGTLTLDISAAQSFSCTLSENITTVDVNGPMAANEYWEFAIRFVQDSTPRTVSWAAKYLFPGGTDPVISTGSGDIDIIQGYTTDGGTTWYMSFLQDFA